MNTTDTTDTRVEQLKSVQHEAEILFQKKNTDYGDAFARYGTVGILVRIGDKITRMQSITSKGINLVEDEKLRDTLLDLHNYAAMGIMLLDNDYIDVDYDLVLEENIDSVNHEYVNDEDINDEDINDEDVNHEHVNEWQIKGSSKNTYTRQHITCPDKPDRHTCSCPSYKFSPDENKTCKHIKDEYVNDEHINEWQIKGSSKNTYTRQHITCPDKPDRHTCSCPSYKFSPDENKTCKHIKE